MYEDQNNQKMAFAATSGQVSNRTLGSAGNAAMPKDAPVSLVQTERLFACVGELHQLSQRLSNAADRIGGPIPECEGAGDRPPPSHLSDRLDYGVSNFGRMLGQIRQDIERIERFV